MAEMSDAQYDALISKIEKREKKSIVNIIKYTILSIFGAVLFIGFAIYQYQEINAKKLDLEKEIGALQKKHEELLQEHEALKERLDRTLSLSHFAVDVDFLDTKNIYVQYGRVSSLLTRILELRDYKKVRWYLGGNSVQQGFDSSSFALFVLNDILKKFNKDVIVPANENKSLPLSQVLLRQLEPVSTPGVGDLVFYEEGYVMFYFERGAKKFVIGMTPSGIVALKPGFGKIVGCRKLNI